MTNGTAASEVPTKNVGAGAGPMNGYNAVQSGRPGQPSPPRTPTALTEGNRPVKVAFCETKPIFRA